MTLSIQNPATEEIIRELEEDSATTVREKARRARAARGDWAKTPLAARVEMLKAFRGAIERDKERLAAITTGEVGKPIAQSRNELAALLTRIDFFTSSTAATIEPETVFSDASMTERIEHEPLGVVANISAWNYPYFVGANVFVPALLTGNTVLYKPSEFATLTGLAIAELLHQSGVPEDVFVPVVGGGGVGASLLEQPLDGVFFTGSYATGRKVGEAAGRRLLHVQLELGGKDPAYVAEDVDVAAAAAATADGAFYNTGQSCCAVERIYVHERIYDAFVEAFTSEVKRFVVGDPMSDATYIGPLTRKAQLAVLAEQVRDATARGGSIATGGKRIDRKGFYFEPTVISNVDHSMAVMRDESFGPIIGIQRVSGDNEALALMNDTEYGLTAAVYSRDRARAERILSATEAGTTYWNCCDRVSPRLPWSGRGNSGLGVTLSKYGILAFTQPKAWHLRG